MSAAQWTSELRTPAGIFPATFSESGLRQLRFPPTAPSMPFSPQTISNSPPPAKAPAHVTRWHHLTLQVLVNYFEGRPLGELPPYDLRETTLFAQSVWRELVKIPRGQTRSYSEIAVLVGRPKAARAVGQACGANPIPLLIPCHRVLAASHRLGGFSGGLPWKQCLLRLEGIDTIA
jgi:O-6-methylguanine DNA methyltransferase